MNGSLNLKVVTDSDYQIFEPRRALSAARTRARAKLAELITGLLLALMSLQMLTVISRKSITVDEIVMIPAAYYHLVAGNFQLVHEHPPLSKILAATPLLFIQPNEPCTYQLQEAGSLPDAKWACEMSFWEQNGPIFASLSFWPRLPMILLTITLGILIFRFARELFGPRAAALAVMLFVAEPTVIGHGRVVQTDIPSAFGYLLFFIALYRYSQRPTWRRSIWLGLSAGVAIVAKYSMLIVGPVLAVFFLISVWRTRRTVKRATAPVVHALSVLVAILFLINAAYFFQHRSLGDADRQWVREAFPLHPTSVFTAIRSLSHILPADFVLGIFYQFWHNGQGHAAGLLGMYSQTGWWYYFPVAFSLKTTIPFLLLSLAALGWGFYQWLRKGDSRFLWLLVPFAVYTVFVLFSNIDIGVRYYLPAYPFLFILGGTLLEKMFTLRRAPRAGVLLAIIVIGWTCLEAWRAYPNQISYMNEFASGAPHWWYLSDSNVEWGDDIRPLAKYLHDRGETTVGDATLGGFFILRQYGIDRVDMLAPAGSVQPRYLAIGASYLNGSTIPLGAEGSGRETDERRVNFFDEYRHRTPEAIIGNSIYVYRIHD